METIQQLKEICQPHRKAIQKSRDRGYLWHRELSIYLTWVVLKLFGKRITPNQISAFNILFGVVLLSLIAFAENRWFFLLLLLLFYVSFLLDKVDGEVARYQKVITLRGAYLDELYHIFVQNGLILAVGINRDFLFFGLFGFSLYFLTRYIRKLRYFIYVKYRTEKDEFLLKQELNGFEKLLAIVLNSFPLKLCAVAHRHDIFLLLVFLSSLLYFSFTSFWFWFLSVWTAMLFINVLRFLIVNFIRIDQDVRLVDENKL